MRPNKYIFITLEKMTVKELKFLLDSTHPKIVPYKDYISILIDEKTIRTKYLGAD